MATAAYLAGRDDEYLNALDRAHREYVRSGERQRATRCAFWVGLRLQLRGEAAQASGRFGRAQRLLEHGATDSAEHGYLLLNIVNRRIASGEADAPLPAASRAAAIGERLAAPDLTALARHLEGRVLIQQGRLPEGLALLDEAMVAVTAGELSPIVTGLIYCSVIEGCHEASELRRARDWTAALTRWCAEQPDMVSFTGRCLVHRAEIMQLHGSWEEALEEARRAAARPGMSRA